MGHIRKSSPMKLSVLWLLLSRQKRDCPCFRGRKRLFSRISPRRPPKNPRRTQKSPRLETGSRCGTCGYNALPNRRKNIQTPGNQLPLHRRVCKRSQPKPMARIPKSHQRHRKSTEPNRGSRKMEGPKRNERICVERKIVGSLP